VTHDFIQGALNAPSMPEEAADRLIELAIEQGAPDNVTVIVIDVTASAESNLASTRTSWQVMTKTW
jgi:PPM family protein phosphatase